MSDKLVASGMFKKLLTDEEATAIVNFAKDMPNEVFMRMFRQIGEENVKNLPKIHAPNKARVLGILMPPKDEEKKDAAKKKGKK
jgi:5,10-methenyltetrahydromethanopterin hydrogenase